MWYKIHRFDLIGLLQCAVFVVVMSLQAPADLYRRNVALHFNVENSDHNAMMREGNE